MKRKISKVTRIHDTKPTALSSEFFDMGRGVLTTDRRPLLGPIEVAKTSFVDVPYSALLTSFQLITDRRTITENVEVDAGLSGSISGVKLGLDVSYSRSIRTEDYSLDVMIAILAITGSRSFRDYPVLAKALEIFQRDPKQFALTYGDAFCSQQLYGGFVCGFGHYATGSADLTKEYAAGISANAVKFGGFVDLKRSVSAVSVLQNFDFSFESVGVPFQIPSGAALKNADSFIAYCNSWVQNALKNVPSDKGLPIRQYFTPYSAVPELGKNALAANWQKYRQVLELQDKSADVLAGISYIRAFPESFESFEDNDLDQSQKTIQVFSDQVNAVVERYRADPFIEPESPALPNLALPKLNKYSRAAIFHHFSSNRYATVVLNADLAVTIGGKPFTIKKGKKYLIFFLQVGGQAKWYFEPQEDDLTPDDVTTNKNCELGTLYMWGQQFTYDNLANVQHLTKNIRGNLQLLSKPPTAELSTRGRHR